MFDLCPKASNNYEACHNKNTMFNSKYWSEIPAALKLGRCLQTDINKFSDYPDDVWMMQLLQQFDLPEGRPVYTCR